MKEGFFMKKGIAILFCIMLLAGCSSGGADAPKTETDGGTKVGQTEVKPDSSNTQDNAVVEKADESNEANTGEVITNSNNDALKDLPEFNVLADTIDLGVYHGMIETDNQGTRIILFGIEQNHKEYKSIFVKNDNRLKIIKLDNDGLIYNEILK